MLIFGAITTLLAAIAVAMRVREVRGPHRVAFPAGGLSEFPNPPSAELAEVRASTVADRPNRRPRVAGAEERATRQDERRGAAAPMSLRNRFILAAILVNVAGYFGGGLYETIWALFVTDRGGGVGLIGITFATFGLTTILVSPLGGRIVDRRGPYPFIVGGSLVMVVTMAIYPFIPEPLLYIPLVAIEAIGFSFLGPATYAVIGRGTPAGKSSTAQGLLGSAGTVGTIVAALASGVLAAENLNYPFFVGSSVVAALLVVTLVVSGSRTPLHAARPGTDVCQNTLRRLEFKVAGWSSGSSSGS